MSFSVRNRDAASIGANTRLRNDESIGRHHFDIEDLADLSSSADSYRRLLITGVDVLQNDYEDLGIRFHQLQWRSLLDRNVPGHRRVWTAFVHVRGITAFCNDLVQISIFVERAQLAANAATATAETSNILRDSHEAAAEALRQNFACVDKIEETVTQLELAETRARELGTMPQETEESWHRRTNVRNLWVSRLPEVQRAIALRKLTLEEAVWMTFARDGPEEPSLHHRSATGVEYPDNHTAEDYRNPPNTRRGSLTETGHSDEDLEGDDEIRAQADLLVQIAWQALQDLSAEEL
ncbi:hypothetical protein BJ546DRAFT_1065376 [Cryomyces antarcticus]|nr:hypothetical protein LTR04_003045 [Oleoguttula sp. CCFEE 6159]